MAAVSRLSLAPVKSLALRHPDEVVLEESGAADDRRFYLVDGNGRLLNGLRHGELVAVVPAFDPASSRLELRFPNGTTVHGEISLGDPVETDWGARVVAGRLVEGPWAAALSEYAGTEVRLVRCERAGAACAHHGVSLLADASVAELARRAGTESGLDGRRFRMLIGVAECESHEEDGWIGGLVAVGEAQVRVVAPAARCATTTRDPSTGLRDFDTLRAIKAYRGVTERRTVDFGVYADVVRPGRVRVGDVVAPA